MTELQIKLFAMQDPAYKIFQGKLIPTVDPDCIIGVRTPNLRRFARTFAGTDHATEFLRDLPHTYYEENNLHGMLIGLMKDFDEAVTALDIFLPYVDNWATCDLMRPKVLAKHRPKLLRRIQHWLQDQHPYTVRFGVEMLMTHFLEEDFRPEYLDLVAALHSEEYYVNMMIAWYFATALANQYQATLPVLENNRLSVWTHNKTIQKAIESYRITSEQKAYLRTLKR